jgi:hypothetical protein
VFLKNFTITFILFSQFHQEDGDSQELSQVEEIFSVHVHQIHHDRLHFMLMIFLLWKVESPITAKEMSSVHQEDVAEAQALRVEVVELQVTSMFNLGEIIILYNSTECFFLAAFEDIIVSTNQIFEDDRHEESEGVVSPVEADVVFRIFSEYCINRT